MKNLRLVVLLFLTLFSAAKADAATVSVSILIERYTLLGGDSVRYDTGYLLTDGGFKVLTSEVYSLSFFGFTQEDFLAVNGRPIMPEITFEGYNMAAARWVRSKNTYRLGYLDYVIVSIEGKQDPNPVFQIKVQPKSVRVLEHGLAVFFVEVEPTDLPISYQWYFKNKPIPDQRWSFFFISDVQSHDAGLYTVSVSSGGKPVMSQKALLQVVKPVVIKTQPKSQTVKRGKNAAFRVGVTGSAPFSYQWYLGITPLACTNSFLTIKNVSAQEAGTYHVRVSNGPSKAYSEGALLTVTQ